MSEWQAVLDQFTFFLKDPTQFNYLAARSSLIRSPEYRPYDVSCTELTELLEQGEYQKIIDTRTDYATTLLLNPRFHFCLGRAFKQMGVEEEARVEEYITRVCIDSILASGDGSRHNPYMVTHVDDEHDVLPLLKNERYSRQCLVRVGNKDLDHLVFPDGSELWFDVSDMVKTNPLRCYEVPGLSPEEHLAPTLERPRPAVRAALEPPRAQTVAYRKHRRSLRPQLDLSRATTWVAFGLGLVALGMLGWKLFGG